MSKEKDGDLDRLSSGVFRFGGYANRHWWWSRLWRNESLTARLVLSIWVDGGAIYWESMRKILGSEMSSQVFIFGQIDFERTIRHPYVLEGFRKPRHIKWWIVLLLFFYHSRKVVKILAFGRRQTWVSTSTFLIKHAILDNYPPWVLVLKAGKYLLHRTSGRLN